MVEPALTRTRSQPRAARRGGRADLLPYLFLAPAVGTLLIVVVFPLVYSLRLATSDFRFGDADLRFVGLANFAKLARDPNFWNGVQLTCVFAFASTVASFVLGFALALLLEPMVRLRALLRSVLLLPMTMPSVTAAVFWLLLLMPDVSIVNFLLGLLGIAGPNWILTRGWAMVAVVMAYVWQWTPFFVLMLLAALLAQPREPYEAAMVDGASWWQRLCHLTLPALLPVIVLTVVIRLMDAFRVFDQVFVMTNGGPGRSTQVLSFVIYQTGISFRQLSYAAAMSYALVIILTVLAVVLVRALRRARAGDVGS